MKIFQKQYWEDKSIYIFGYGSLMYPTGVNGRGMKSVYKRSNLFKVNINGYQRGLYAVCTFDGENYVKFFGLKTDEDQECLGMVFKIRTYEEFLEFLKSEGVNPAKYHESVYRLHQLSLDEMQFMETPPSDYEMKRTEYWTLLCDHVPYGEEDKKVPVYTDYLERVTRGLIRTNQLEILQQVVEDVRHSTNIIYDDSFVR